jgi:hypothetical protein
MKPGTFLVNTTGKEYFLSLIFTYFLEWELVDPQALVHGLVISKEMCIYHQDDRSEANLKKLGRKAEN